MYSFYTTLVKNSRVIINIYLELDLPCVTRKSGVGLPICNLPCSVLDRLKSKLTISFKKNFFNRWKHWTNFCDPCTYHAINTLQMFWRRTSWESLLFWRPLICGFPEKYFHIYHFQIINDSHRPLIWGFPQKCVHIDRESWLYDSNKLLNTLFLCYRSVLTK